MSSKYTASQKLWKIEQTPDGYYYVIKLGKMVLDRIKIGEPAVSILKDNEVIGY